MEYGGGVLLVEGVENHTSGYTRLYTLLTCRFFSGVRCVGGASSR